MSRAQNTRVVNTDPDSPFLRADVLAGLLSPPHGLLLKLQWLGLLWALFLHTTVSKGNCVEEECFANGKCEGLSAALLVLICCAEGNSHSGSSCTFPGDGP